MKINWKVIRFLEMKGIGAGRDAKVISFCAAYEKYAINILAPPGFWRPLVSCNLLGHVPPAPPCQVSTAIMTNLCCGPRMYNRLQTKKEEKRKFSEWWVCQKAWKWRYWEWKWNWREARRRRGKICSIMLYTSNILFLQNPKYAYAYLSLLHRNMHESITKC